MGWFVGEGGGSRASWCIEKGREEVLLQKWRSQGETDEEKKSRAKDVKLDFSLV